MGSGINQSNNVCVALNNLYACFLSFIDNYEFDGKQLEYISNIRYKLEIALPMGKFVTSKLEDFKIKEDPTYNQKKFFEEDKNYIEEMVVEAEKLKENYRNYKPKDIDESVFFNELTGYKKYELMENYEEVYYLMLMLNDTLDDNQKKKFEQVIKRILHCYYMAYRMCKKLQLYKEKYPFDGDEGKYWLKDQKMTTIRKSAKRFRKINEERFSRNKK